MIEDIERRFYLNTVISSIMEFYNLAKKEKDILRQSGAGKDVLRLALERLIILLSPFTPHLSEELWGRTGHTGLLARFPWPDFDPELAREKKLTIVVQVNGKLRDKFEADPGIEEKEMREQALALERIQAAIAGRTVRKVICIKDKLVNVVV